MSFSPEESSSRCLWDLAEEEWEVLLAEAMAWQERVMARLRELEEARGTAAASPTVSLPWSPNSAWEGVPQVWKELGPEERARWPGFQPEVLEWVGPWDQGPHDHAGQELLPPVPDVVVAPLGDK